ncbi:MAG: transcription-repair coupling factor [Deltaproteobacteria bacterium]|nr:transcription-repair coupling factor [Deltaproteobacteria bacterium]
MAKSESLKDGVVNKNPLLVAERGLSSLVRGQRCVLSGLVGSSRAYCLASLFRKSNKPFFVILPTADEAESFAKDLAFFIGKENVLYYPITELLPFETEEPHPDITGARLECLYTLKTRKTPFIAVASAETLIELTVPAKSLIERSIKIGIGDEAGRDELVARLIEVGYESMSMVEERGELSVRGAILDLFPAPTTENKEWPLRLEFMGDEIESIRTFDPSTQRSLRELTDALILPARQMDLSAGARRLARERLIERADARDLARSEWEPLSSKLRDGGKVLAGALFPFFFSENLGHIFDYLPKETIIVASKPEQIKARTEDFYKEVLLRAGESLLLTPEELYKTPEKFREELMEWPLLEIFSPTFEGTSAEVKDEVDKDKVEARFESLSNLALRQDISTKKELTPLSERITKLLKDEISVFITAHNHGQAERMVELLEEFSVTITSAGEEVFETFDKPRVVVLIGALSSGFTEPSLKRSFITEEEIFGERQRRRAPSTKKVESFLNDLRELKDGDTVVHTLHGIGVYRGLKRMGHDGVESDYLLLHYDGGDALYLPVERMDLISKYRGIEGGEPRPDKLGGQSWNKTKKRVKKAVASIAGELLKLYAERSAAKGYGFAEGGHLFEEFEASFEYEETPDQALAIKDTLKDMGKEKPMDRLICGDVGYGKTEVAMRAAFRSALDSKQTAILVPTTVLALQHYLTFKERFAPYPVRVEVLSRFRSRKEQNETLERLAKGEVDILIGTHRLLQKDVIFRDIGLVIVDEEHRFGVKHKERLRELRREVDTLTLTATPIPRTLNMSLADIRDLSIINTPPEDRLSIHTRVIRFDDGAVKEALSRELKRGGQIFFVHNRVKSIEAMRDWLEGIAKEIKPDVKIVVGHGQMRERELEKVMLGFSSGEFDILLSTTIIESGLDIPRANTIIINRADCFGLAELYQLRGRVGRSHHRAYAYLICPDETRLTPEAQKRMEVIRELSELGSGFRVAAFDLEIRGAGDLLGSAQSGRIIEVGFDMYTELLGQAVAELKGERVEPKPQVEVKLNLSRYIPDDYIPDTRQRLEVYKKLAMGISQDELLMLGGEVEDRYGRMPELVENLFAVAMVKAELSKLGGVELTQKGSRFYLSLASGESIQKTSTEARAFELISKIPEKFRATPDGRLVYIMTPDETPINEARYVLKELSKR